MVSSVAVITLTNLSKDFGAQTLFSDVTLQLNPGARYGLVGANGSGKTTLLKMIIGDEEASTGSVAMPRKLRLGVLEQDHFKYEELPIIDVAMMGHTVLWQAMAEKEEVLARSEEHFDAERFGELEDIIASFDGYSFEARCAEILEGLGIPTASHRDPLSTLSGGFKLRVLLARVLAAEPQCLLLDEPTNHLDIISIRWLEIFLAGYQGCAVVISHDHRFLDNVCTHILDVDYETVTLYTGNYTAFVEAKQMERHRREHEIGKREKQIADHAAFVERFRAKATKARQAQSKVKQMERIVIDRLPQSSRRYPKFRFTQKRPSGKEALELKGLGKAYADNQVLRDVNLNLRRGDRLAIIGPNGIGKSTLLKIAAGELEADTGEVKWGHETHVGYFPQDHEDIFEGKKGTVEGWLGHFCEDRSIGFVRSQLGLALFSGEDAEKKLTALSGGEAARLIFARMAVEHPNVMILDEPTNHLDLEAIEALVAGLKAYDGTLIFVSHDRWFVSQLASRVFEINDKGINDFIGTYEEYLTSCGDDHLDADTVLKAKKNRKKKGNRGRLPASDAERRQTEKRIKELSRRLDVVTTRVDAAEQRIGDVDELFCEPGFFEANSEKKVRALQAEQQTLRDEVAELMEEWETIEGEIAELRG